MVAPFGIEMLGSIEGLDVVSELGLSKYQVEAPSPHPLFSQYIVQATSSQGVVWIKANTPSKDIDPYGNTLRTDIDRLAEQLSGRYGRGRKTDFLAAGSLWDDPRYWMQAILDHDRHYFYVWDSKSGELPQGLESIFVGAVLYSVIEASVTVEYTSTSFAAAEQEIEQGLSSLL